MCPGQGRAAGEAAPAQACFLTSSSTSKGQLEELRGQKDTLFATEPLPPAKARAAHARLPALPGQDRPRDRRGQIIEFIKDVVFARGHAEGHRAEGLLRRRQAALSLQRGPGLVDEEQGSELHGRGHRHRHATAATCARATACATCCAAARRGAAGLLGGKDEPDPDHRRRFDYDGHDQAGALPASDALLRVGQGRGPRAARSASQERRTGKRRLEAAGARRLAHAARRRRRRGEARGRRWTRARRRWSTTRREHQIVYKGDVVITPGRHPDQEPGGHPEPRPRTAARSRRWRRASRWRCSRATRTAHGRAGTYTPRTETMVLVGEQGDAEGRRRRQVQGRSLTFHVGRRARSSSTASEQVRTQTDHPTSRKEPPPRRLSAAAATAGAVLRARGAHQVLRPARGRAARRPRHPHRRGGRACSGPNGAGKTTTFYMVVGLARPDSGQVFLGDDDITAPAHVPARAARASATCPRRPASSAS